MSLRGRALALGRGLAVATLSLVAVLTPLAIAALGLAAPSRRAWIRGLRWGLVVWGGYALLLMPVLLATPGPQRWLPLTQGLVGVAAIALLRVPRGVVIGGAIAALTVLTAAAASERWLEARSWQMDLMGGAERIGVTAAGSVDRIVGFGHRSSARMDWTAPRGSEPGIVRLSFEARADRGPYGWDFIRSPAVEAVEPLEGGRGARVTTGATGDPYLVKRYTLPDGLAGGTFIARLELRSPMAGGSCGRIYLGEPGGRRTASTPVCAGPGWQPTTVVWEAPADAGGEKLDLIVNDFDGTTFEVRDVDIRRLEEAGTRPLAPPFPEQARVRVMVEGEEVRDVAFEPTSAWSRTRTSFALPGSASEARVRLRVFTESGSSVLLRNVSVEGESGAWQPVAVSKRVALWYPAPNLLGHTAAATAAVAILSTSAPAVALLGSSLGILVALLSGSRAAVMAVILAICLFAVRHGASRSASRSGNEGALVRWITTIGGVALVGGAVAALLATDLFRFLPTDSVARVEIWRSALSAFADHPLSGLWGEGVSFAQDFRLRNPTVEETILHAHNLWLHLGATFGVLGFAASVWLCTGLGIYAFRSRGVTGIGLLVCILMMNLVDSTLLYFGVLYPLLLGLNPQGGRADADGTLASS